MPPPPRPSGGVAKGPKGRPHSPPPPLPHRPESGRGGGPPTPPPALLGSHKRGPPPPKGRGGVPPPEGTATRWGERRLDLLPRTHTGVLEQRAQRNRKEAAPHITLP